MTQQDTNRKKRKSVPTSKTGKSGKTPHKESVRFLVVCAYLEFEKTGNWNPEPPKQISDQRDRRLFTQLLTGMVRHHLLLDAEIGKRLNSKSRKMLKATSGLLKLAFFEMLFMQQIPEHATINEAVLLTKRFRINHAKSLVNAVLRTLQRDLQSGYLFCEHHDLSTRTSHPEWMIQRWNRRYGESATQEICEQNNRFTGITVRPLIKTDQNEQDAPTLENLLKNEGLTLRVHPLLPEAVVLENAAELWKTETYRQGKCYVQDASSQLFLKWIRPVLKGRVLDLCAAPGGKSLALMCSPMITHLTVNDSSEKRMELLKENFERIKLPLPEITISDGTEKNDDSTYDVILVDAPCSSTGTIRKNPDIKFCADETELLKLCKLQKRLLHESSMRLESEGYLIYSTCSLEAEENEMQISDFLQTHSEFKLVPWSDVVPEMKNNPQWLTPDGFFQMQPNADLMGFFGGILKKRN